MLERTLIHTPTQQLLRRAAPTIACLTETLLAREVGASHLPLPHRDEAVAAMQAKVAQMPPHLRLGMAGLTLAFAAYARARTRQPLHDLSLPRRAALLEEWQRAPLGPCRQWVQFYEKMGAFLYYSIVEEDLMPPTEVR